jgi:hypothetical protein
LKVVRDLLRYKFLPRKLGVGLTRLERKAEDVSHGEERRGIHPKKKIVHELHG